MVTRSPTPTARGTARGAPNAASPAARRALREIFALKTLRPGQREVIDRVLAGRSALAVMPTGAGKSLCYQLPAVLMEGCTVVVSPLIALMKDQCEKLCARGVAAVQLNSHCSAEDTHAAELAIADGSARIVLTTPERFGDAGFAQLIAARRIALVVVDEAHCISQWGHDFRPAFLEIEGVLKTLGHPPVLALTATAPDDVAKEIRARLHIPEAGHFDTGVFRANLRYAAEQMADATAKRERLLALVRETAGSGIVYTATVRVAIEVEALLREAGESVGLYHGRLSAAERRQAQDEFMSGQRRVMVATNAFGMGIDKADIRFVLHFQIPAGLDAYYQESGRAGRDGQPALCFLLFAARDRAVQQFFMAGRYPDANDLDAVHRALNHDLPEGGWSSGELAQHLDMPQKKLQGVLQLLLQHGMVEKDGAGRFGPGKHMPAAADLPSLLAEHLALRERDQHQLDSMVLYAQSGRCRWQLLLDHLAGPAERDRCQHCDNCARIREHEARLSQPIVLPGNDGSPRDAAAAVRPAAPGFAPGDMVRVRRYGVGRVQGSDEVCVTIGFDDGSSRSFHPDFVRRARAAALAPRIAG